MKSDWNLQQGHHSFSYFPGAGNLFFITAQWKGKSSSIKIISRASGVHQSCSIEYLGEDNSTFSLLKAVKEIQDFSFNIGDSLLFIGYVGSYESGLLDTIGVNQVYSFQFATNTPCPGKGTIRYEGQIYNTIQVFSQCWLNKNLNAGKIISSGQEMEDNDILEKYCYNNVEDSCTKLGGFYQWWEMMQYSMEDGTRGICPPGWHIPTDEEWKVLEGSVDSLFGIGDPIWDSPDQWRGYDVGKNLKAIYANGSDLYDFSAIPTGYRNTDTSFTPIHLIGWWSSTESKMFDNESWIHYTDPEHQEIIRLDDRNAIGVTVRCIRDRQPTADFIELDFTATENTTYKQLDSIKVMNHTQGCDTILYFPDTTLILEYEPGSKKGIPNKNNSGFDFTLGDEVLIIGYIDTLESGILDTLEISKLYTLQFAYDIPCPGTPTVSYEGQVYNTVQIGSQCWLKENLNVGTMVANIQQQSDNDTIEKYCYNNEPDSCTKYGGLYQWDEMMQYTTQQGAQGICPPGWHLPTDEEWKVLEGMVDSQHGIGDNSWDDLGYRGYDAGANLKTTSGWSQNGNGTDLYGFTGLPGGLRGNTSGFGSIGDTGHWWTSTERSYYYSWNHGLGYSEAGVWRGGGHGKDFGFSVRCIKD
jgi:uncharacterized protein (TIGR02145 family)